MTETDETVGESPAERPAETQAAEAEETAGAPAPQTPAEPAAEAAPETPDEPAAEATEAPAEGDAAGVKVRRAKGHYAGEVESGQSVQGLFVVQRKQLPIDRAGRPFLALTLVDRTGRLEGRLWDDAEAVAERFREGDHVRVKGTAVTFQGRLQVRLDDVDRVDAKGLDVPNAEFLPAGRRSADLQLQEIVSLVDAMDSAPLKALLHAFLDDPEQTDRFKRAPAAQSVHHAWVGGLIEHTLSVMKLGLKLCDHYPHVNRDLVLTGCFLHDYGKIEELAYDGAFGYTRTGRLVGHLVMTSQWVHEKAAEIDGFPDGLLDQVVHMVVSHHGELEYGSPKRPKTLEALLVHYADVVDARVSSYTDLLQDAGPDGWTDYSRLYDRPLYRGGMDPQAVGNRRPARKRKRKKRKKPGERAPERKAGEATGGGEKRRSRSDRPRGGRTGEKKPGRGPRTPKGEARGPKPEPKKATLTFNPFAALGDRGPEEPPKASEETQGPTGEGGGEA